MENQEETYRDQKNIYEKIRDRYYEIMNGRNTIDKLMKDKVSEYYLMEEFPLPIKIGSRTLWIGNLTIENNREFLSCLAKLFAGFSSKIINLDIISDPALCYDAIVRHKEIEKSLIKLVKKTLLRQQWYYNEEMLGVGLRLKIKNFSYGYFARHVTTEKLAQILFIMYQYNLDAEKKNLKILAEKMGIAQDTQTYIYSWLQNLDGLIGDFVKPQSTKSDSYQEELTNIIKEKEKNDDSFKNGKIKTKAPNE